MKNKFFISIFVIPLLVYALTGGELTVYADETYLTGRILSYSDVRFNNDNWYTLPHPKIAEFTITDDGNAFGLTETGISFVQFTIPNDVGIHVQRFEIQDHYHYVVDGNIVDSFEELSAQLALAYLARAGAV